MYQDYAQELDTGGYTLRSTEAIVAATPDTTPSSTFYEEHPYSVNEMSMGFAGDALPAMHLEHPTLLPDQQSTYSELSANLAYLSSLSVPAKETLVTACFLQSSADNVGPADVTSNSKTYESFVGLADATSGALLSEVEWPSRRDKKARRLAVVTESQLGEGVKGTGSSRDRTPISAKQKNPPPKRIPPPYGVGRAGGITSSATGKKLGLACLFCRERKIACGRPSESSPDQTCK